MIIKVGGRFVSGEPVFRSFFLLQVAATSSQVEFSAAVLRLEVHL